MNAKRALTAVATALVLVGAGCGAASNFAVGDDVYSEWTSKSWYTASVTKTCDKGWEVKYDDGSTKCNSEAELIMDKAPKKAKVGDKVIAKWTGSAYYDATVDSINEDVYTVKYYDGVTYDVAANELRFDPR
jgi:hypothetical protein